MQFLHFHLFCQFIFNLLHELKHYRPVTVASVFEQYIVPEIIAIKYKLNENRIHQLFNMNYSVI